MRPPKEIEIRHIRHLSPFRVIGTLRASRGAFPKSVLVLIGLLVSLATGCENFHALATGTVTDTANRPLAGVSVTLFIDGDKISEMTTEIDGKFEVAFFGPVDNTHNSGPDLSEVKLAKEGYGTEVIYIGEKLLDTVVMMESVINE